MANVRLVSQPMTSSTTPAPYVANQSTAYFSNVAWYMFDQDAATFWKYDTAALPVWASIDLGEPKQLNSYDIYPSNTYLDAWKIQGSTDGAAWVDVDSRSGQSFADQSRSFTLATPVTYRYYRIYISAGSGFQAINAWNLWGPDAPPSVTLTGTAPGVTGSFGATVAVPAVSADLAGNAPVVTGSFTADVAGAVTGSLAGTAPAVSGSFGITASGVPIEVATDSVNRANGMPLVTEWHVEVTPEVTTPTRQPAHDYAVATSLPNPALVEGRPT